MCRGCRPGYALRVDDHGTPARDHARRVDACSASRIPGVARGTWMKGHRRRSARDDSSQKSEFIDIFDFAFFPSSREI